ncbi:DUF2283 domain-containing protein [Prauserella halophila]|uniref:DUF2283 domain-containing protein n=1 Tax=Prauserella halophila TaxID=185641 RepID=A0ABN1WPT3_9PSEU|nr:DUF2283 domain-containing protein [Prauserella halophila]
MHIEYDPEADAAYLYLTDNELAPGRRIVELETPPGISGPVIMDWKDGKITGVEVVGASDLLHADLLAQAARPGGS